MEIYLQEVCVATFAERMPRVGRCLWKHLAESLVFQLLLGCLRQLESGRVGSDGAYRPVEMIPGERASPLEGGKWMSSRLLGHLLGV